MCTLRLDFETFSLIGTGGSSMVNEGDCLDTLMITVMLYLVTPNVGCFTPQWHFKALLHEKPTQELGRTKIVVKLNYAFTSMKLLSIAVVHGVDDRTTSRIETSFVSEKL